MLSSFPPESISAQRDDVCRTRAYTEEISYEAARSRAAIEVRGSALMSIVRVGLAETKKFAEGYDAIFGRKTTKPEMKRAKSAKLGAKKKRAPKKRK